MLKLKESCLYVDDLDKARAFYHGILQLPVIGYVKDRHIFFRAGEVVLLCFISKMSKEQSSLPPHFGGGDQHLAFEVDKKAYDDWKKVLRGHNIEIIHEEDWGHGIFSFYFYDFEHNVVEMVMPGLWD